jgi:hypothetical protein
MIWDSSESTVLSAPALWASGAEAVQAAAAVVREEHCVGHLGAVPGLEMLLEEARHFHDVRIGVMNDAPAGIGHCSSGSSVVCESLA